MSKKAFTLAEVLITLGIIGVVAAMLLPALINKINMKEYITRLKTDYSILSQAFTLIVSDEGSFPNATSKCKGYTGGGNNCFRDIFAEKMKPIGNCDEGFRTGTKNNCFPKFSDIKELNGRQARGNYLNPGCATLLLANGSTLLFYLDSHNCEYSGRDDIILNHKRCGWITIDVNGYQKPNTFGKDIYVLYVFDKGIKPLAYEFLADHNKDGDCTPQSSGYSCSHVYLTK